jgi:hypothetical protein
MQMERSKMQQRLPQEEIEKRLQELYKTDPEFPDVVLGEDLPAPIAQVVEGFCKMIKASRNSIERAYGIDYYREGIRCIDYAKSAFTNRMPKLWIDLCNLSSETIQKEIREREEKLGQEKIQNNHNKLFTNTTFPNILWFSAEQRAQKIAQVILHMPNHVGHLMLQKDIFVQNRIKPREKRLEELQKFIGTRSKYLPHLEDRILHILHQEVEKESSSLEKLKNILFIKSKYMQINRQSTSEKDPVVCTRHLQSCFIELYDNPHHRLVVSFVAILCGRKQLQVKNVNDIYNRYKDFSYDRNAPINWIFQSFLAGFIQPNSLGLWNTQDLNKHHCK